MNSGEKKSAMTIGKLASILTILMYVSYVSEIIGNFNGHPVGVVQPLLASLNGLMWCLYAYNKRVKDWAVFVANFPGIIFGLITVITVYIH